MARVRYVCLICGTKFEELYDLVRHFEESHPSVEDVKNWRVFRLHGYHYGLWRKFRDLRDGGYAKVMKE